MTRGRTCDSGRGQETRAAQDTDESNVVSYWAYRRLRQARPAAHNFCDVHINTIVECIGFLRERESTITARTDPLLHLRFGLGLRRVGLERAINGLNDWPGTDPYNTELRELIGRLSAQLSAIPAVGTTDLDRVAEELRALCSDLSDHLYTLLLSCAPQAPGSYRASPPAPD